VPAGIAACAAALIRLRAAAEITGTVAVNVENGRRSGLVVAGLVEVLRDPLTGPGA
jgi:hypothetical protein